MTQRYITALVPIKGASERVPGKNIRSFCGKPLLHYVLNTLQHTEMIDRIVVNTDADSISAYATTFSKAIIHRRPTHLCGHTIPMNSIIAHDLSLLDGTHFLQTHVTNPLLSSQTVERALEAYFSRPEENDALFSVVAHQNRFFRHDKTPINHDPNILQNTQDLPLVYEENSCLYIFSREAFMAGNRNRLGQRPLLFVMSKLESVDIDTEEDFRMAEVAWKTCKG